MRPTKILIMLFSASILQASLTGSIQAANYAPSPETASTISPDTDLNLPVLTTIHWSGSDGIDDIAPSSYIGIARYVMVGLGGNDTIATGNKEDYLDGGKGNDTLHGGNGQDVIIGGEGADILNGGNGWDLIYGGAGNDYINGGINDDTLFGGDGDDVIDGDKYTDKIYGGRGDDIITPGDHVDYVYGGEGNDTITEGGDFSDDFLYGNAGNDTISAGNADDYLEGGTGNDTLIGGSGYDTYRFFPGDGIDTIIEQNDSATLIEIVGVSLSDVSFYNSCADDGNDLIIKISGSNSVPELYQLDVITVESAYQNGLINVSIDGTIHANPAASAQYCSSDGTNNADILAIISSLNETLDITGRPYTRAPGTAPFPTTATTSVLKQKRLAQHHICQSFAKMGTPDAILELEQAIAELELLMEHGGLSDNAIYNSISDADALSIINYYSSVMDYSYYNTPDVYPLLEKDLPFQCDHRAGLTMF